IVYVYDGRNGKSVLFEIKVPGLTLANGKLEMFAPAINFSGPQPDFKVTEDTNGNITGKFTWQPEAQVGREQLYNFVFRASKNSNPAIQNRKLVNIYVSGNNQNPCSKTNSVFDNSTTKGNATFLVYPNPFTKTAVIKLNGLKFTPGIYCAIYNMQGQKVVEIPVNEDIVPLNGNIFNPGIYTYHIRTPKKIITTGKFVVQK
ncbi:MAG: T9SS type A sorting domain-containing protein, partial [Bacteroidia bacterium]